MDKYVNVCKYNHIRKVYKIHNLESFIRATLLEAGKEKCNIIYEILERRLIRCFG